MVKEILLNMNDSDYINSRKADNYVSKAVKTQNKSQSHFCWFPSDHDNKKIVSWYIKGAEYYRISKKYGLAAKYFLEAAAINDDFYEAIKNINEASGCYHYMNDMESVYGCYYKIIQLLVSENKLLDACNYCFELALIYEDNNEYTRAFDVCYLGYKYSVNELQQQKCLIKCAILSITVENYKKAAELYEKVVISTVNSYTLKFSHYKYILDAVFCHIIMDQYEECKYFLQQCASVDTDFLDSKEYRIIIKIFRYVRTGNVRSFNRLLSQKKYQKILQPSHYFLLNMISMYLKKDTK